MDELKTSEALRCDRVVAISGATGGIGEALVRGYAKPNTHLLLAGRNSEILARLKKEAESFGASAEICAFDLRDREAAEAWSTHAAKKGAEVFILCAGVSASVEAQSMDSGSSERTLYLPERQLDLQRELEVNAVGNILSGNAFARAVLQLRRQSQEVSEPKTRRIVFISSLAALTGLAGSPGYSASKAALRTYGEALRRLLHGQGIGVTVIFPGYVESNMSQRYVGSKPWLMPADAAAKKIIAAIEAGRSEYAFPWILAFGIRLLNLIPRVMQNFFLKGFFFTVVPDAESRTNRKNNNEK